MDKKKKIFIFAILIICAVIIILAAALKGGEKKVQDVPKKIESSEKDTVLSGLKQELANIRVSDDSLSDMSEIEISAAIETLHKNGREYKDISVQDLRHANDIVPEVKLYTTEDLKGLTETELAKTGVTAMIGDYPPVSPFVFWVLPEKIKNGYNIAIESDYLYDWNYAKQNCSTNINYLSGDEALLKECIGKTYSDLLTNFNTYTSYHGLDADEYLSPCEEGRFVLLRWFRFKDSDKKGWAVCYVDVINDSNERRTKRDCSMTKILFEI